MHITCYLALSACNRTGQFFYQKLIEKLLRKHKNSVFFSGYWIPQVVGAMKETNVDTFCPDSGKTKSMIIYTSNTEAVKVADLVFLDIATQFPGARFSWQKDNTYLPDSKTPWFWKIFDGWIDSHPSELALRRPVFPYSRRLPSDWVV